MIGDHLDVYTFQKLISDALALVPDTIDKRQGSIIYDTLSVSDVQLAEGYIVLKGYYLDTYALTAHGEYLDMRVGERGVYRYPATCAVKRALFLDNAGNGAYIPIGARFSTVSDNELLIYYVSGIYTENGVTLPGYYQLTCESAGTQGNGYIGNLMPVTYLNGVAAATMDELLIPARDEENDESLLARYIELINYPPFGGNISQYRQWTLAMAGVGAVQIYPVWNGGGTVKVSIIGADFLPASGILIQEVQEKLDPESNHGQGLGLAPIGHTVTVSTPEALAVNIEAGVTLAGGTTTEQVLPDVKTAISGYLLSLRKEFGKASDLNRYTINVYRARIISEMLSVDGVENVTDLLLNGEDADLALIEDSLVQQLPVDGTVTLHAV